MTETFTYGAIDFNALPDERRALLATILITSALTELKNESELSFRVDGPPLTGKTTLARLLCYILSLESIPIGQVFRSVAHIIKKNERSTENNEPTEEEPIPIHVRALAVFNSIESFELRPKIVQVHFKDETRMYIPISVLNDEIANFSHQFSGHPDVVAAFEQDHLPQLLDVLKKVVEGRSTIEIRSIFQVNAHLSLTPESEKVRIVKRAESDAGRELTSEERAKIIFETQARRQSESTRTTGKVMSVEEAIKDLRYDVVIDTTEQTPLETTLVLLLTRIWKSASNFSQLALEIICQIPGVLRIGPHINPNARAL